MKDVQVVLVVEEAPHIPESIFKGFSLVNTHLENKVSLYVQIGFTVWNMIMSTVKFKFIFFFFFFNFIFKLYKIVLVLPNIEMNPPQVYMCSAS